VIINRRVMGGALVTATLNITSPNGKVWFYDAEGQFHEETGVSDFVLSIPCLICTEAMDNVLGNYETVATVEGACVYRMLGDLTVIGWS